MRARHFLAGLFAALVLAALPAHAGLIGTPELLAPAADAPRERVEAFLARDDVQRELVARDVSPADAAIRVASLTEAELQMLSGHIDAVPAGAGLGTVELLLIIIIILLLI